MRWRAPAATPTQPSPALPCRRLAFVFCFVHARFAPSSSGTRSGGVLLLLLLPAQPLRLLLFFIIPCLPPSGAAGRREQRRRVTFSSVPAWMEQEVAIHQQPTEKKRHREAHMSHTSQTLSSMAPSVLTISLDKGLPGAWLVYQASAWREDSQATEHVHSQGEYALGGTRLGLEMLLFWGGRDRRRCHLLTPPSGLGVRG